MNKKNTITLRLTDDQLGMVGSVEQTQQTEQK